MITKVNEILASLDLKDGLLAFKAINAKKEAVYPIFETYCRNLAITILNLQTIFDMETFVLGGGISAQSILIEEVNRQFDKVHHEIDFIGKIIKRSYMTRQFTERAASPHNHFSVKGLRQRHF